MNTNKSLLTIVILLSLVAGGVWLANVSAQNGASNASDGAETLLNLNETADALSVDSDTQKITNTNTMNNNEEVTNTFLRIVTNLGEITVELYMDSAPITAGNFLSLVEAGFYNNIKFHRVIPGFMIQGGDPNTKEDDETIYGTGGPGYSIQDEFSAELSNVEGTLSMANAGPNTGGSQFFINTADNTFLDGKHAVFGHVVSGLETVSKIESTQTKERDIPATPVVIEQITVTGE